MPRTWNPRIWLRDWLNKPTRDEVDPNLMGSARESGIAPEHLPLADMVGLGCGLVTERLQLVEGADGSFSVRPVTVALPALDGSDERVGLLRIEPDDLPAQAEMPDDHFETAARPHAEHHGGRVHE